MAKLTKAELEKQLATLKQAKQELEEELAEVYSNVQERVTDKDFYQGIAWGFASATLVCALLYIFL